MKGYHLFTAQRHIGKNLNQIEAAMIMPPLIAAVTSREAQLMQKAQALEATFLAEMLSFSGLGKESDSFGGGIGEAQFASFLREEQAKLLVARGGIGLAQQIFESLKSRGEP